MKKLSLLIFIAALPLLASAQGWPVQYGGVMLQAFYWDSYDDTNWQRLQAQADELSQSFDLVWIPQSANCGGTSMGYDDLYWFSNYDSSFGNEQQLRSMISTFKAKGLKTIADVVINHRRNVSNWVDFPNETYKGVQYQMTSTDICANDDNGKTLNWATQNGYQLSANNDTGEGWDGMRDLDHTSANVQANVKAYLDLLLNDLGYAGVRYDMVKGYSPQYTALYNAAAQPEFSVGAGSDKTKTIKNWINGTAIDGKPQSAAFDFQFRYTVRNAANNGNWAQLAQQNDGNWPLISSNESGGGYRRYAVTFVENHDTEWRSNGERNDPLLRDTLAANAFLLAMPGTPCVFLKHWQSYPTELKAMIAARKQAGITNTSSYSNFRSAQTYFANMIDSKLLVVVGNTSQLEVNASQWVRILSGHHYAYYFAASMNMPWVSLASSNYQGEQQATLTAVTADSNERLCYSLNDNGVTEVASGTTIVIPQGNTTLKVWLKSNPSNVITRNYVVEEQVEPVFDVPSFCTVADGETCAFFEAPLTWTNTISCWAWDNKGNYTGGSWPGTACTLLGQSSRGRNVWKWSWDGRYTAGTGTAPTMIIFNNTNAPQTADLSFVNGGYYMEDGLKVNVLTSINKPKAVADPASAPIYNMRGQRIDSPRAKGIYIRQHKKFVVR